MDQVTSKLSTVYIGQLDFGPEKATDGDTRTIWQSLTVTRIEVSPWIQLNLTRVYCILEVVIYNQAFGISTDGDLENVLIAIGNAENEVAGFDERYLCAYNEGQPPNSKFTMVCNRIMYGHLIRLTAVQINASLRLRELEVYGKKN
ncbi:uncharacterized protein [Watersipora subatra]|uniref:uncharacterized protein n=1 Tax=Watersipora subatra TaxID=2589382 RepID=UPI00355B6124